MTYIEKIAFHLGKRDEVPNQELARLLVEKEDQAGIDEIVSFLDDTNKSIQSDCIKVVYEIGYIAPHLITKYADKFIDLLDSKSNRMVWGAMIGLSTIAEYVPDKIWPYREKILQMISSGSVITNVSGVRTLINLAKAGNLYFSGLIDHLMNLQKQCRDVDFAKRAEEMVDVISPAYIEEYRKILEDRKPNFSNSAQKRLEKVIKKIE